MKNQENSVKSTAIITGGAMRIGREIALMLADKGYHIALHFHRSESRAHELVGEIEEMGVECALFRCDFNEFDQVEQLIPKIHQTFPNTSILVNNASIFERARFRDTDADLYDRHFNTNLKAPFFLSRNFARIFKTGHIINILDTKVARNLIEYFAYTMTKKSLYDFTKMAAVELGPEIRVNGVGPGLILPPPGEDTSYLDRLSRKIPLKKSGDVGNVVSAIRFLLDNDYITGECIFVDGGEHLK